jgi:DNA-binding NarL/FixJ family response regulator
MWKSAITVLCIDDHNLVRESVVRIIEQEPGLRVVAEARTVKAAIECFMATRPAVALVSLQSRGFSSRELIRALRCVDPCARIAVYTKDDGEVVELALDAGATGVVPKEATGADLIRIIQDVSGGNGLRLDTAWRQQAEARDRVPSLTAREVEILESFGRGLRAETLAATLQITHHTLRVHIKNIFKKLGVGNRAGALTKALRCGLVRLA